MDIIDCSSNGNIWKGYSISHIKRKADNNTLLTIDVKTSAASPTGIIQVNEPIGFMIDFVNTLSENFRTHVTFDSDDKFSIVGKGLLMIIKL